MPKKILVPLFLTDLKRMQGFFDLLDTDIIAISPSLELLWMNEKARRRIVQTRQNERRNPGKCFESLFGAEEPCKECPLLKTGNKQYPGKPVFVHDTVFSIDAYPLANEEGFLVFHHDISSAFKDYKSLMDVLKSLPMGIILVDRELTVKFSSQGFFRLFPFISPPIEGKDLRLVVSRHSPPFPKKLLDFIFKRQKELGRISHDLNFMLLSPNPRHFHVLCLNPGPNDNRVGGKILFLFSDHTEERLRQSIAIQRETFKKFDALLQSLSDKLVPGLDKIHSLVSGVPSSEKGSGQMAEAGIIRKIREEADRLLKTLNTLNLYKGKKPTASEVNINTEINKLIREINPRLSAGNKDIKIKTDLTKYARPFYADLQKLSRALRSMFEVAIENVSQKASATDLPRYLPLIEIQTRMHGSHIELLIKDNGAGEPSPQAEETLSLCRIVIESMGGELNYHFVKNVGGRVTAKFPTLPVLTPGNGKSKKSKSLEISHKRKDTKRQTMSSILNDREIWILGERDHITGVIGGFVSKIGAIHTIVETPEEFDQKYSLEKVRPDVLVLNISDEKQAFSFHNLLKRRGLLPKTIFLIPPEFIPLFKRRVKEYKNLMILNKPFSIESLMESMTICLTASSAGSKKE